MSDVSTSPSEQQLQQALRAAIAATDRGDYAGATKVFNAIYGNPAIKAPPDGLSAYGLCVAVEGKQTKRGVELCRAAIAAQFYDSRHYGNLIKLNLKRGNRKGAVEVLEEALGRMPEDSTLLALREKMGIRDTPPASFLSRANVLNRMRPAKERGRETARREQRGRFRIGSLHPFAAGVIVLLFFAAVFGGTFLVLYRQAYG
ncbi:MAG: hypothetical protein NDJ92_01625 [Thermoanaerobaculia bacterium]|nr:hypothetical protein [Thermoanaerobaculia bacterium]